jgi:hypothetical protein
MTTDEQLRKMAKERVEFKQHLVAFVGVNALLIMINLLSGPDALWFYWVTLFWGFGVLMHGFSAYGFGGQEAMVEREYQKLKKKEKE